MELITELFDYQRAGVEKLLHVKVGALYMEMGTGKTRTALELLQRRLTSRKVSQALWLCPYSVQRDLPELLSEHAIGFEDVIRIAGIESLSSSWNLNQELREYVSSAPTYLIVDESLLIKNPGAYRTQNVTTLSKACAYKLILNGTPVSKNEVDLYAQWYVLDWRILGYRSYWSFAANHVEMDDQHPGRIRRVLNVDYLARKIAPYTYEVSKSDVLDLPNKVYYTRGFALTNEQEEHYDDVAATLLEKVNEMRPETIYRLFSALQGITSGFAIQLSDDNLHSTRMQMYPPRENPRIQELMDLLEDIGNEQAVIYCQYTQEIADILSVLGDSALPFYGEMSQKERQCNKNKFRDGRVKYLVANKSCAKFGLNLQFCRNEIFYNNDWDWGTRAQAEDRLHRAGQTREVRIYDIVAGGTIDTTIMKCLLKKESLSDRIKQEIASHNGSRDFVKAAIYGHTEEVQNDKDISGN